MSKNATLVKCFMRVSEHFLATRDAVLEKRRGGGRGYLDRWQNACEYREHSWVIELESLFIQPLRFNFQENPLFSSSPVNVGLKPLNVAAISTHNGMNMQNIQSPVFEYIICSQWGLTFKFISEPDLWLHFFHLVHMLRIVFPHCYDLTIRDFDFWHTTVCY